MIVLYERARLLRVLLPALVACVPSVPAPASAQALPGYSGPGSAAEAEWLQSMRIQAERGLQDWLNLMDRRAWQDLGSFFTDRGVLVDGSGVAAAGRDSIAELLARLPERSDLLLQVTGVRGGTRLMHVTGRVSYFEAADLRVETFTALLEVHRDRWMFRALAFAPLEGALAAAPFDNALEPNRAGVHPPRRTAARGVVEPVFIQQPATALLEPWQAVGVGAGLELDGVAELRAFYWQGVGGDTLSEQAYGAELRTHLTGGDRRVRPHLAFGAGAMPRGDSPGTRWEGIAGAGVGLRLSGNAYASVTGRVLPAGWISEQRRARIFIGIGASYALGGTPEWRDAEPSVLDVAYELTELPRLTPVVVSWAAALSSRQRTALEERYASMAVLHTPGSAHRGASSVVDAWLAGDRPGEISVDEQRVSGAVAYAVLSLLEGATARRLVNIYERNGNGWQLHAQVAW
jgi:hypothetical protein